MSRSESRSENEPALDPPTDGNTSQGLGRRAARGALISLTGSAARTAVQILGVVVLARLLTPAEYGLLAMVAVVIGIADIFRNFGLYTVAVRAPSLSTAERTNLFWTNLGIGFLLCVLIWLGAPLIALVFREPELVPVARALAFTFVLSGAATQFRASLARELRFGALAAADTLAPVAALVVAVVLASRGWGYHALIAQQLTQYATMTVLLVALSGWFPGRYQRQVPMRGMWSMGWSLVTTQLINYVANNADQFVIGLRFGAVPSGWYNRAFQLLMQPYNQVRVPITDVATPILARVQGRDEDFLRFLSRAQVALGHTVGLGLVMVAVGAGPIVRIFLGDRWSEIGLLFAFLALGAFFQLLDFVASWAFVTRGLVRELRNYTAATAVVRIGFIVAGSLAGVEGVAAGYAAAPMLLWPVTFLVLGRCSGLPVRELVHNALRILAVALACGGSGFLVGQLLEGTVDVLLFLAEFGTGLAVWGLLVAVVPAVRADARSCVSFVRLVGPGGRGR